jgi:hypothetical protein
MISTIFIIIICIYVCKSFSYRIFSFYIRCAMKFKFYKINTKYGIKIIVFSHCVYCVENKFLSIT